jgi:hypothetical protein
MRSQASRPTAGLVAALVAGAQPWDARAHGSPEPPATAEGTTEPEPDEPPSEARESRAQRARGHYRAGEQAFAEERYAAAATEFELSYRASAAPVTLYNIALSHELANAPVPAIIAYERYLEDADVSPDERAEVERTLARLGTLVGAIELRVPDEIELAEIRVDGVPVETDGFMARARSRPAENDAKVAIRILTEPGPRVVEFVGSAEGQRDERRLVVAAGQTWAIEVSFDEPPPATETDEPATIGRPPEPPPGPEASADLGAERRARALKASFFGGLALTATSGVGIAVLGGLTRREERLFNEAKCDPVCEEPVGYPHDHKDRAENLMVATNVMIGVTAALGAATAIVGILAYRRGERTGRRARRVHALGSSLVVLW